MTNNAFEEFERFEKSSSNQLSKKEVREVIRREKARKSKEGKTSKNTSKVVPISGISKQPYKNHIYKCLDKADIISLKAEIKQRQKELKRQTKDAKKLEKAREKRAFKTARQVNKNVYRRIESEEKTKTRISSKIRLTSPKKRNIFSRLYLANKFGSEDFEFIEDEIDMIKSGELPESAIEDDWKDIQKYEDAKDDVWLRRGWNVFKITLAGLMLTGAIFACKAQIENEMQRFNDWKVGATERNQVESVESMVRRAESAILGGTDQNLLYELTDGEPSLENWEALPDEVRKKIRNPVIAAEAAYNNDMDQSYFYLMVDGEITTEKWQALPDEIKKFIREPSALAKECFENGKDQAYLYQLSRGAITEEFWQNLPSEVKQYIRNPIELAKQYAMDGDDLGYLKALSLNEENMERVDYLTWELLPNDLKEYVKDPSLVIKTDEKTAIENEDENSLEIEDDMER